MLKNLSNHKSLEVYAAISQKNPENWQFVFSSLKLTSSSALWYLTIFFSAAMKLKQRSIKQRLGQRQQNFGQTRQHNFYNHQSSVSYFQAGIKEKSLPWLAWTLKERKIVIFNATWGQILKDLISWAGCQNNPIDVNFHLLKVWKVLIKN